MMKPLALSMEVEREEARRASSFGMASRGSVTILDRRGSIGDDR